MHDNDEHVWLYAAGLVGEYTRTLINSGLFQADRLCKPWMTLDFYLKHWKETQIKANS